MISRDSLTPAGLNALLSVARLAQGPLALSWPLGWHVTLGV